jgi:hypothetical protein
MENYKTLLNSNPKKHPIKRLGIRKKIYGNKP